jgi:hypothetical protein
MERQNVTLSLPKSLLKKAKVLAAIREKSLSELLRESLEDRIRDGIGYKTARKRQIKLLKDGLDLGTMGKIKTTREEIHERR